jgi:hypothetical protein
MLITLHPDSPESPSKGDSMPKMDGTGPQGLGPMTGGGRGQCAGGEGRGRGMRREYHATGFTGWQRGVRANPQMAATRRNETLDRIQTTLSDVVRRLDRLENDRSF